MTLAVGNQTTKNKNMKTDKKTTTNKTTAKPVSAKKEGAGGKGNQHAEASKAQLQAGFERDSGALASVLVALGAVERIQRNTKTGSIVARRVYADLAVLVANRDKLPANQKKLASAAIDAARAVSMVAGDKRFVSLELYKASVAVRARADKGQYHKA